MKVENYETAKQDILSSDDKTVIDKFNMTDTWKVPTKSGYDTYVIYEGDTVCVTNMSSSIDVSRFEDQAQSRGASEIECFYVPSQSSISFSRNYRSGMLMFEDLASGGDNDYNDFVCRVEESIAIKQISGDKYSISLYGTQIKPLALGGSIKLGFGFEIRDKVTGKIISEYVMSEDVRTDFFNGSAGFLNTVKGSEYVSYKSVMLSQQSSYTVTLENPVGVNWFIISQGKKLYTTDVSKYKYQGISYSEVISDNLTPYGLFIPGVTEAVFAWSKESSSIWNAYPSFAEWVSRESVDSKLPNPFYDKWKGGYGIGSNLYVGALNVR